MQTRRKIVPSPSTAENALKSRWICVRIAIKTEMPPRKGTLTVEFKRSNGEKQGAATRIKALRRLDHTDIIVFVGFIVFSGSASFGRSITAAEPLLRSSAITTHTAPQSARVPCDPIERACFSPVNIGTYGCVHLDRIDCAARAAVCRLHVIITLQVI